MPPAYTSLPPGVTFALFEGQFGKYMNLVFASYLNPIKLLDTADFFFFFFTLP